MYSLIYLFVFFPFLILFFNPRNVHSLLLASSSATKLFDLHSLSQGNLTFLGDSHLQHRSIALTKAGTSINASRSAGVVLYNHPISFLDPRSKQVRSFYTRFAFYIENIDGVQKAFADGLTFLISPDDHLLGTAGYLGLADSESLTRKKFIAIEFDTKRDSVFHDPDDNHVGLDINSLVSVKLVRSSSLGINLKSGYLTFSWIDYKSDEKRLEIFLSDTRLKPMKPLLKVDIDMSDYLRENMFVGFSAATEGSMQLTYIEQWEFTIMEFSPPPPPSPPESGTTFPNPSKSGHGHSHHSKFAIVLIVGVVSVSFALVFRWFYWKKLMGIIQKPEETNNLEMQTVKLSGGIPQEIQFSILADEVARGLNIEKELDNEAELIRAKIEKSSIPPCSSLPVVKRSIYSLCNGLPLRTNDIASVR